MSSKDDQPDHTPISAFETQALNNTSSLDVGEVLVGRFKIKKWVGQGQHGTVYLTDDLQLNVQIAIKVLHPSICNDTTQLIKFKNELLLVRQLSHPNIIRVHEYYSDGDCHFITMDWIGGKTLRDRMRDEKFDVSTSLKVVNQLLNAVQFAQEHGVTHRDIKPENVMFDESGQLFLADFGLSSFNEVDKKESIEAILGTPVYAPPEYLQSGKVNTSTDVYAIGVIAFELLYGELPFNIGSIQAIINAKLSLNIDNKAYPDLALPNAQQLNVKKWLATILNPYCEGRFKHAKQAQEALYAIQNEIEKKEPSTHFVKKVLMSVGTVSAILLSVLLLLPVYNNYFSHFDESNVGNDIESKGYYSLAVLANKKEPDLAEFTHYLNTHLFGQHQIKTTSTERTLTLVERLGFEPPYDDGELGLVLELLDADAILLVDTIGVEQQEVVLYQVTKVGSTVLRSVLSTDDKTKHTYSEMVQRKVNVVNERFRAEQSNALVKSYTLSADLISVFDQIEKGQFSQAQEQLDVLLAVNDKDFLAWFAQGQIHFYMERIIEAEHAFTQTVTLGPDDAYSVLFAKARLEDLAGNLEQAESYYLQLKEATPYRISTLFELVNFYMYIENFAKAEMYLLEIAKLDKNHPTVWFELGKLTFHQGHFEKAIDEYFTKALIVAKKLKNQKQEADVLNAFGVVYQQLKELSLASDYYHQGLDKYKLAGDEQGIPKVLNNLGILNIHIGKYQSALSQLEMSLELYRNLGDQVGESEVLNDLGVLAEEQGQYSTALEYYRRALAIWQSLGSQRKQASIMNNIAFSYFMLLEPEHAIAYWRQAEQLNQKIQHPLGIIHIRQGLGQLELAKANWKNAYHLYNKTLEDAQELKSKEFELIAKGYLTKLTFLQGNFANSINELANVYEESQSLKDKRAIVEFGDWLIQWYVEIGDKQAAAKTLSEIRPYLKSYSSDVKTAIYQLLEAMVQDRDPLVDVSQLSKLQDNKAEHDLYIRLLIESARFHLREGSKDISAQLRQLRQIDFELFQYHHLSVLELRAAQAFIDKDLNELKKTMREAELLMRRSGQYWRAFHFDRLRAQLAKIEGKPDTIFQQRLAKKVRRLLSNLPAEERTAFLVQQDYLGIQDGFRELSRYD